jgi:hypothetical protein
MLFYKYFLLVFCAALMVGCSSGVKRLDIEGADEVYILSKDNQVKEVMISLSPEAKKKHAKNLKFSSSTLRDTVYRALQSQELLGSSESQIPVLEILVTNMRVRSNFSAVAFGFLAGADSIEGEIYVKDSSGKIVNKFTVSTSYALGGLAGGQDSARMDWLYEEFAKQTLRELQGLDPESTK